MGIRNAAMTFLLAIGMNIPAAYVVISITVACATVYAGIHESGDYALQVTPASGVGKFQLSHDSDRPILGFYGGIGLRPLKDGKWANYYISTKQEVDYLIERCRQSGMNRIYANIMFQWTDSELLGPVESEAGPHSAEMFGYAIEQAHANNLQVYVDVPVFGRRPRDEPFVRANSEDIFARRADGSINEHFFSPANEKVRAYRIAVLLEVLSHYPVDGIQLDFIRWEDDSRDLEHSYCNYGYSESLLKSFRLKYNLPNDYVPAQNDPRFVQARADCVTLFLEELQMALRRSSILLPVGVYNSNLYGRQASLRNVCQDWKTWEDRRLVDEHHPMFYMDNKLRLTRSLQTLIEVKRKESTIFGPIFLDGPGQFTPENVQKTARQMIKIGCDGIWFCTDCQLEENDLWPVVKQISEFSLKEIRAERPDPIDN